MQQNLFEYDTPSALPTSVTFNPPPFEQKPRLHRWFDGEIGRDTRYRLYAATDEHPTIVGETPFFVSTGPYSRGLKKEKFSLQGVGMHPGGCAMVLEWFHTLRQAQARAVELAGLTSKPTDRVMIGNAVYLIGDRVEDIGRDTGFGIRRRTGRITHLTDSSLCTVLWDGYDHPCEMLIFLLTHSTSSSSI